MSYEEIIFVLFKKHSGTCVLSGLKAWGKDERVYSW